MALLQLETKSVEGIDYIDHRPNLYYNKFKYRARFHCKGITLAWYHRTIEDIEDKIRRYRDRYYNADAKTIYNFYDWKEKYRKDKLVTVRIEGSVASIFSNDLSILKTLESLNCTVHYTEVDTSVEQGVKYFVNKPKYNHRIYLRGKRVTEDFKTKLNNFINRYKNTETVIVPSNALKMWLQPDVKKAVLNRWIYNYKQSYCSSNYFIDYNDDSTLTLFSIMFPGMIYKNYRLEKQPDKQN